jgi:hypothetical protein
VSFVLFTIAVASQKGEQAREMGFLSAADQRSAEHAGVTDATVWQSRRREAEFAKAAKAEETQRAKAAQYAAAQKQRDEAKARAEEMRRAKAAQDTAAQKQRDDAKAKREALSRQPAEQIAFIRVVSNGRVQFARGQNELQRGSARPSRASALCAATSPRIDGWVGKITQLTTNGDGDGVVSIEIGEKILLGLRNGDKVRLFGALISGGPDCYRESSPSLEGSILEPEFVTRFSRVEKIEPPAL